MTAINIFDSLRVMIGDNEGLLGWTFLTLLICSLLLYTTRSWIEKAYGSGNLIVDNNFRACSSPECVRCGKYQLIRAGAYARLCKYADQYSWKCLGRLLQAVRDCDHLKSANCRQNPNVLYMPVLEAKAWWDDEGFKTEKGAIEDEWDKIYSEFNHVRRHVGDMNVASGTNDGWTTNDTPTGCWNAYYLYNQGQKMNVNCLRCPKTTQLIESLPSFMAGCLFGNACFSVIQPNTLITEHYGPCNIRIRCHLGKTLERETPLIYFHIIVII